jgi:hypothetical protein
VFIKFGRGMHHLSEGKTLHEKSRDIWLESIKMGFKDRGYDSNDWIHQAQYTVQWQDLVNMVMNVQLQ